MNDRQLYCQVVFLILPFLLTLSTSEPGILETQPTSEVTREYGDWNPEEKRSVDFHNNVIPQLPVASTVDPFSTNLFRLPPTLHSIPYDEFPPPWTSHSVGQEGETLRAVQDCKFKHSVQNEANRYKKLNSRTENFSEPSKTPENSHTVNDTRGHTIGILEHTIQNGNNTHDLNDIKLNSHSEREFAQNVTSDEQMLPAQDSISKDVPHNVPKLSTEVPSSAKSHTHALGSETPLNHDLNTYRIHVSPPKLIESNQPKVLNCTEKCLECKRKCLENIQRCVQAAKDFGEMLKKKACSVCKALAEIRDGNKNKECPLLRALRT